MKAHIVHDGKKPVHSFLLYLKNEKTGFEFNHGVGSVGRNNTAIDYSYQYNVASITKTLVATIILQLCEEDKLSIDDPIKKYLESIDFIRYNELHIFNGKKYQDSITIEMLLNHTSGISDVFTDAETRFNLSVLFHPKRKYTAQKFYKRYFKYKLNKKPANIPEKGYHYSDINYMLLGFLIEEIEGKSLPEAIRERIITPLHLKNTYFEFYEEVRGTGKRIDAFLNRINITKRVNTSYEWGGGGIVSTAQEMAIFIEALFGMKLFKDKATLERMLDTSKTSKYGKSYGLGIYKWNLYNKTFYGHGGFYGSILAYSPEYQIIISSNVGQSFPPFDTGKLINKVIKIISK
ncbi:serine hydrolase domain-containing protein [Aquimarina mytili]|uniref:Beta-lactamase family protein n=1 Tax=Aquimarina mytili TaxID=874423 RepID=A0A937D9V1_9FLAO|nr:serine hydrolase domain-containing protein [Aquimarina mytili]MBL0684072.1 beta-lactamase family protein [Aquimarina mytili]